MCVDEFARPLNVTVHSEILVSRVCGGSKFAKKKKIRKIQNLVTNASTPTDILLVDCQDSLLASVNWNLDRSNRNNASNHRTDARGWTLTWFLFRQFSSTQRHNWAAK